MKDRGFKVVINGKEVFCTVNPQTPLLYFLRNDLSLNGPKFGCGLGQCGACSILVDGEVERSCITMVEDVKNKEVLTLEGLGSRANPHPLQKAFMDHQAMQCGYCSNGMIMTAAALLNENPVRTEDEIKQALSENLCRCGAHQRVVAAVRQGAKEMADEQGGGQ